MSLRPDDSLRDRLAHARSSQEVAGILGPRRIRGYAVGFAAVAVACAALVVYLAVDVALGDRTAWVLAAIPGPLFLILYCGSIAYGSAYFAKTGRRWPRAELVNRIAARLNSNLGQRRRSSSS